jgi:hypothetical protein
MEITGTIALVLVAAGGGTTDQPVCLQQGVSDEVDAFKVAFGVRSRG